MARVFYLYATGGSIECLKLILEKYGAGQCSDATKCLGSYGNSMLHCAAQSGKIEMVKLAIAYGFDVNQKNILSETPLHLGAAGYSKGIDLSSLLLKNMKKLSSYT